MKYIEMSDEEHTALVLIVDAASRRATYMETTSRNPVSPVQERKHQEHIDYMNLLTGLLEAIYIRREEDAVS